MAKPGLIPNSDTRDLGLKDDITARSESGTAPHPD